MNVAQGDEARKARHDARTALNQIIGYAEMLQEQCLEQGRSEDAADLGKIERAARRLLAMFDGPLAPQAAPQASAPPPSPAVPAYVVEPLARTADADGTLLVVDDNEFNREVLGRRLSRRGYRVQTASGGLETLDLVTNHRFDLILLDVMMPDLDGFEVLARIRQTHPSSDLPVIMVTALDSSADVVKALGMGANDYVTKPLDMPVVLARVETQMAIKRARDEIQTLNRTLESAQERIAMLMDSVSQAMQDIPAWSTAMASELGDMIDAPLAVWVTHDYLVEHLCGPQDAPPNELEIDHIRRSCGPLRRDADLVVPVCGLTGTLFGAMVVGDRDAFAQPAYRRLLEGFARQLGGALELHSAREELEQARALQELARQDMLDRGIDLLMLCPQCGRCYDHHHDLCEDDGTPLRMPHVIPYRVAARYRLESLIGLGGMGAVYRAQDERLGRRVAIKAIKAEHFDDQVMRLRFENEARAVARIDHPGVVSVYDSGELDDGSLYSVMEYLKGRSLAWLLDRYGPGTPAQVATLLRQGASALDAAHTAGIVHRDIKPENIFVVSAGDEFLVKILDFGVAKEITTADNLTQTGSLVGTPRYMSPEQILGQEIDARSDIYSFAAVGYQALTGRKMTDAEGFGQVLVDVVQHMPPAPSTVVPQIPHLVDDAFLWALSKSSAARPEGVLPWVNCFV